MKLLTISKILIAVALLVTLGLTVQAAQDLFKLDGLYIGHYPQGFTAVIYYFKPSGLVLIGPHQIIEPEIFSGWKKVHVPMGEDIPGKDESWDLIFGIYGIGGNGIELQTLELKINLRLQILIYEEIWKELWEKPKAERKSFRFLGNKQRIEIDGATLLLQKDQTGRKLEGEYAVEYRTLRMTFSGRAKFASDGGFSIDELWLQSIGAGGENHGTGRYEVRGHDIIFRYSDGRVETRVFGDLGKISGKETITLGHYVWVKGLFDK
jgi:hypothetical protein